MAESQTGMPPTEGWRRPASDTNQAVPSSSQCKLAFLMGLSGRAPDTSDPMGPDVSPLTSAHSILPKCPYEERSSQGTYLCRGRIPWKRLPAVRVSRPDSSLQRGHFLRILEVGPLTGFPHTVHAASTGSR